MNAQKVKDFLELLFRGILYHDLFFAEFVDLISGTGIENKIFKLLSSRLASLNKYGVQVTNIREFENISGGLYSMHFAGSDFNIRVLFSFLPNGQPVLLLAFYERAGKRKTDYTPYKQPALNRLNEMKGDYENGYI